MKHPHSFETDEKTRKRMSHVHLERGSSENILALSLWHEGIRYRRNYKELPGSPDIAITKYKIAIFIDGEFWHGYDWGNRKKKLKRNKEYWTAKIEENMLRDQRNDKLLTEQGWIVIHFWEKLVKNHTDYCVEKVKYFLRERMETN